MEQLHIYYSGNLQGVGFRSSAKKIADELDITGWVKNLPDGRVELLAQGDKTTLSKMKNLINNKYYKYMTKIDTTKETPSPQFKDFILIN